MGTLLCPNQMAVGPNTQAVPRSQLAQEPFPSSQPSSLWQQPSKRITSHSSLHNSTPKHPAKTPRERGKRELTPRGGGRQVVGFPFFFFEAPRCHLVLFFCHRSLLAGGLGCQGNCCEGARGCCPQPGGETPAGSREQCPQQGCPLPLPPWATSPVPWWQHQATELLLQHPGQELRLLNQGHEV